MLSVKDFIENIFKDSILLYRPTTITEPLLLFFFGSLYLNQAQLEASAEVNGKWMISNQLHTDSAK